MPEDYDPERAAAEGRPIITDKRGGKNKPPKPVPTAEELLASEVPEMTDQEKQELLARQADEEAKNPAVGEAYSGGGVNTEGEVQRESVITAFVILCRHDGTALAGPLDMEYLAKLDVERDVTETDMFKACAEIQSDIQAGKTAQVTINYMQQQAMAMQQAQQAGRLAQSMGKRGRH